MKRPAGLLILLILPLLLTGCTAQADQRQFSASFLGPFDTVTHILGHAGSEAAFTAQVQTLRSQLEDYHRLFDIYHSYEGLNNLKTLNDRAALAPVPVDERIIDLLMDCRRYHQLSGGRVNVALGGVLSLWHAAREQGLKSPATAALPDETALRQAAAHADISDLVIDSAASTVFFADPLFKLDVGAVAKGWAVERVAQTMPEGFLISVGGNVRATGPKQNGLPWLVGVQNPDDRRDSYLHTLHITSGSVVTSGDYQRAFIVDGRLCHHIIDPSTLQPAAYWRAVTVVCPDSGLADALSTALFLMPLEEGRALAQACGAQALWVGRNENIFSSAGYNDLIQH